MADIREQLLLIIKTQLEGVESTIGGVRKLAKSFSNLLKRGGVADATDALLGLGKFLKAGTIVKGMLAVGGAVTTTASKLAMHASEVERLANASAIYGKRLGVERDEINRTLEAGARLGISRQAMAEVTTEMLRAEIGLGTALALASGAMDIASTRSLDYKKAIRMVTHAIRSGYPWRLKQLGLSEKFNTILEREAYALGTTKDQLDGKARKLIMVKAFLKEAAKAEGAFEASLNTAAGAMRAMPMLLEQIQEALGYAAVQGVTYFATAFAKSMLKVAVWLSEHLEDIKRWGAIVGVVTKGITGFLWNLAKSFFNFFKAVGAGAMVAAQSLTAMLQPGRSVRAVLEEGIPIVREQLVGLGDSIIGMGKSIADAAGGIGKAWTEDLPNAAIGGQDKINVARQKALDEMNKDLEEENERYKNELEERTRTFKKQLARMIWAHVDKKNSLIADIEEENEAYRRAYEDRLKDHNRALAKMESRHDDRVETIKERMEDEKRDYADSREDMNRTLEKELRKGLYIYGKFNAKSSNERIQTIRDQMADEAEEHDKRLADLEEELREENKEYQDSIDERKTLFDEETEDRKREHDERITNLENRLQKEKDVLSLHLDDVRDVTAQARVDDITELKNQFAKESEVRENAHQQKLKDIEDRAAEAGALEGDTYMQNLIDWMNQYAPGGEKAGDLEDVAKNIGGTMSNELDIQGEKAGEDLGLSLLKGLETIQNKWDELVPESNRLGKKLISMGIFGPVGQMLALWGGQHGGIVPGPAGAPIPTVLHGGERVVPRTGADVGGQSSVTVNITGSFSLDDENRVRQLADRIVKVIGRRSELADMGAGF